MTWEIFLACLIAIESGGNPNAIGDLNMKNKAYGCLQIRKPYIEDVNRVYRKSILKSFGRPLREKDMFNPIIAKWTARHYLMHYGKKFIVAKDWESLARIHNGGPKGYEKKSTLPYAQKFLREVRRNQ